MIEIKNRWTGAVICSGETLAEAIKNAPEMAWPPSDLTGAALARARDLALALALALARDRDETLTEIAEIAVQVLVEMKCAGTEWLEICK